MKILVVGGGGREHAIIKSLSDTNDCEIWCCPGNGGISYLANCVDIASTDISTIVDLARKEAFDYCIVAQDDPLALGLVDELEKIGIPAFGPSRSAAQIESSKVFSKNLMKKYNIPTAKYEVFSCFDKAMDYINQIDCPVVIKADGLALGKGVLICSTQRDAESALKEIMVDKKFGDAGRSVVIEEFLTGPEVSMLTFVDGNNIKCMVSSMDHKRAHDGDTGLNTGGMGVIAPNPYYTPAIHEYCIKNIYKPTVEAMKTEGRPFKGCLYFGLMLTSTGPKVIEYNARFGDPEAQCILPLLEGNLLKIMQACTNGNLDDVEFSFRPESSACVVMASDGYPKDYQKGVEIQGLKNGQLQKSDDVYVYHAGTRCTDDKLETSGGRVLSVVATSKELQSALEKVYSEIDKICIDGSFYRHDIGKRALLATN